MLKLTVEARYVQTFESGHGLAIKPRKAWVFVTGANSSAFFIVYCC